VRKWLESSRTWNWWPYVVTQQDSRSEYVAAITRLRHWETIATCKTLSGAKRACERHARGACRDCLGTGNKRGVDFLHPERCGTCEGSGK
jgi:DnaJ-class molecular chaperone